MAESDIITIVDKDDNPIGSATKNKAWKRGLIHRVVHVIATDEKGRILLQKRSSNMELWPNCWTDSASGHVDAGEDWGTAVERETREEIGLTGLNFKEIGTFFQDEVYNKKILKRFNKVYKVKIQSKTQFDIQQSELQGIKWFSLEKAKSLPRSETTSTLAYILNNYF